MKTETFKFSRKATTALLLCTGLVASQPLSLWAENDSGAVQIVQQQKITVKGTVNDAMGPVIGASVVEKGNSSNGTITDMDGNFSLSVQPGTVLVVSYIGYKTQEVTATVGKAINVTLQEDNEMLDEVVVVGFGTQKKVNLTGSVGIATAKEIESRPVTSAVQALQGLVPGLKISTSTGELDKNMSISVRGTGTVGSYSSGSPLILIDGTEGDLNTINPQDIENISVLKDAAASSIYGSRGARMPMNILSNMGSTAFVSLSSRRKKSLLKASSPPPICTKTCGHCSTTASVPVRKRAGRRWIRFVRTNVGGWSSLRAYRGPENRNGWTNWCCASVCAISGRSRFSVRRIILSSTISASWSRN